MSVISSNPTCQERFATLDPRVTTTLRYELPLAAKGKGGWRNACTERRQKGGERGYLEKGLKCRGKEHFKVGIRQDRESILGKACGQCVGGACWPWGRSLTAEEAKLPRVLSNCLASPGAWPIQATGSPLYPRSSKTDRGTVKEGECDRGSVFSNMDQEERSHGSAVLWPIVRMHRVTVACVFWMLG